MFGRAELGGVPEGLEPSVEPGVLGIVVPAGVDFRSHTYEEVDRLNPSPSVPSGTG